MTIDWITILFQIFNFLVLVFLLRHFLYHPIVESMEKREKTILDREQSAREETEKAIETNKTYEKRLQTFEQEKDERFKEITAQVSERKQALVNQAKLDADALQTRLQNEVRQEASLFMSQIKEMISQEACSLAELTLKDLANTSLETMVFETFMSKLDQLEDSEEKQLIDALKLNTSVKLISAFDINQEQLQMIHKKLSAWNQELSPIKHSVDADLVCGFILEVEGHQVLFNIHHYLKAIEKRVIERLTVSTNWNDEHEA